MTNCILSLSLVVILAQTSQSPPASEAPNVFDFPALQARHVESLRAVAVLMARGAYAQAEAELRQAIGRVPHDNNCHYNLACVLARLGRSEEALTVLDKAVELGFRDARHIGADEDLKTLRDNERFQEIVKKASEPSEAPTFGWRYQIKPARREDGQVLVSEENTAWNAQIGVFRSFFQLDRELTAEEPIAVGRGKVGDLLRVWNLEGTAAGNHGDLYDNHDGDHSNMNFKSLPQLTRIEFSDDAKQRKLHMGAQISFLYNGITIGNSSTAITGSDFWRSQPRYALTHPRGPILLYMQYVGNHLYFYPEHRDHDPPEDNNGHGDVYPANTPYMIVSQGSSGSDRVFMDAVGATLAALRPDVKLKLAKTGTLMAAIQMIFRSSNKMVVSPQDYLTGTAHPSVFEGSQIDEEKMVTMAHSLTTDALPPMVQLKVVEEDEPVVGRDYFDVGPRQRLFDTPCAIARVMKSTKYTYRMVVSAAGSKDLDGKPLTYQWVLLRGDPKRVQIKKLDEAGSQVELVVSYQQRRPIAPASKLESNRVDIGAFVSNGQYHSAPGFVCFYFLDNEKRVYDDQQRIEVVDYTDPAVRSSYVDPVIDFRKDWRDEYQYAGDGSLRGWTRIRGTDRQEFTAEGQLIVDKDAAGKPTKTVPVRYIAKRNQRGSAALEQVVAATTE